MEGKSERRTRKIRGVMKNGDQSETVNRSYFCVKNDRREVGMNTQWIALVISLLGFWHQYITAIKTAKKQI